VRQSSCPPSGEVVAVSGQSRLAVVSQASIGLRRRQEVARPVVRTHRPSRVMLPRDHAAVLGLCFTGDMFSEVRVEGGQMPRQVRIQPENPSAATVRTQVRPVPPLPTCSCSNRNPPRATWGISCCVPPFCGSPSAEGLSPAQDHVRIGVTKATSSYFRVQLAGTSSRPPGPPVRRAVRASHSLGRTPAAASGRCERAGVPFLGG
jgi:hypothetical protein